MPNVNGTVASGFEGVAEEFERNFTERGDVGANFCVYHRGEKVVDIAGGVTEPGGTTAYGTDALQLVFSSTKGITSVCAAQLIDAGALDPSAAVADYWPEFGAAGKHHVTVEWLLSHQAGLADVDRTMTLAEALDWDVFTAALAASSPVWNPGETHGYHAVTFGHLVGELVRRVSGEPIGQYVQNHIAKPLDVDMWIGLPPSLHERVVPLIPLSLPEGIHFGDPDDPAPDMFAMLQMLVGPDALMTRALTAPGGAMNDIDLWNTAQIWEATFPAANGISNAAALAKMYAATVGEVDGVRLFGPDTLAEVIAPRTSGPDEVLMFDIPFGLGFMRDSLFSKFGSPTAFGHYGLGGSVGFADHEHELGVGYVMNKLELGIAGDPRTSALIDAVYAAI